MPTIRTTDHARECARKRWSKPENVDRRVDALAEQIRKLVESAPPLTDEQRARLARVLPPTTAQAGEAA